MQSENRIFALDIGTRNVVGLVGVFENGIFKTEAMHSEEHRERAMIDGQIENISQVAEVVKIVHDELTKRLNVELSEVHVAAAGRALLTTRGEAELPSAPAIGVTPNQVAELQLLAIDDAYAKLEKTAGSGTMTCVGHSVVGYKLDGHKFSSLLDHKGEKIEVEIIATFLPQQVVDSLYTAMNLSGLVVAGLTLEPIAAMNAIVPKELRSLNIALVDIGAGTSDIAISSDGAISAYTMATYAGDEITEKIVSHYVVDFNMAEHMKRSLGKEKIEYTDILGNELSVSSKELEEVIIPAVEELSLTICNNIQEANTKPPQAIFLVGGGSKVVGLAPLVAGGLSMDSSRVAIGGNNYMKKMVVSDFDVSDPGFATPFGIAITAGSMMGEDGFYAFVNGKKIRLYSSENQTVMDALLLCGYKYSQLLGRPAKPLQFRLNNHPKTIAGSFATAAIININGESAGISTAIKRADKIVIEVAKDGVDAYATVGDVLPKVKEELFVSVAEHPLRFGSFAVLNGRPATADQPIANGDELEETTIATLGELMSAAELDIYSYDLRINGVVIDSDYQLKEGDEITIGEDEVIEAVAGGILPTVMNVELQGTAQEVLQSADSQNLPEQELQTSGQTLFVTINDKKVELPKKQDRSPYLFVDMLNFIDIDPTTPKSNIKILKNGSNASYLDVVSVGDRIDVSWDE